MKTTRRDFMKAATAATAGLAVLGHYTALTSAAETVQSEKYKTKLFKAMIGGAPSDDLCEQLVASGIEGLEVTDWDIPVAEAQKRRLIAEKHGIRVHSIMRGWAQFNDKDRANAQKTIEQTKTAIRTAAAYGAETILLVPCRTGGMPMPEAWDFDIDFDPKTLEVKSVAQGDNSKYEEYIQVQNYSTKATIEAMHELIPVAAKEGVIIAIENVWNNLWCDPEYAAALVHYFDNPWVKAYFDLGNHTKYSKPQLWIKAYKHSMVKLHIKGYKITKELGTKGGGEGDWCATDQSSTDWKEVRKLLDDVNYNGWISVEEGNYDYAKYSQILDDFIKG